MLIDRPLIENIYATIHDQALLMNSDNLKSVISKKVQKTTSDAHTRKNSYNIK